MSRDSSILLLPVDRPKLSQLVFFLLGCLATTTFAPLGWYLLAPLLLLPFLYVCLTLSPRDAARHGFWFGVGLFLTGTYWIYISVAVFGQVPVPIALLLMLGFVLLMSLFMGLTGLLISRLTSGEPWLLLLVAPASWVAVEWMRGWFLTGFPWLGLGYGHIDSPLAGWAPVIGVYGMSVLLVLSTAAALVALLTRKRQQWIAIAIAVLPWVSGGILKTVEWTQPAGAAFASTLIQGGITQDRKWLAEQFQPTLDLYRKETLRVPNSAIVVWPEVAIPALADNVEDYIATLESDSERNGQSIVFGILERVYERTGDARIYNSVFLLDGESRQIYRKRHLVPFGEYFPVPAQVREWMRMLNLPHSDLSSGNDVQPLLVAGNGTQLSIAICHEDAFGAEQLYALPEASLLINVSNDAWFGDSVAPHQHLQMARMRALEVGRYVIRATNTGISAFIGPHGKIIKSGAQFKPVTLTASVQPRKGMTPYASTGNWPVIGLCLLIVAAFWLRTRSS